MKEFLVVEIRSYAAVVVVVVVAVVRGTRGC